MKCLTPNKFGCLYMDGDGNWWQYSAQHDCHLPEFFGPHNSYEDYVQLRLAYDKDWLSFVLYQI